MSLILRYISLFLGLTLSLCTLSHANGTLIELNQNTSHIDLSTHLEYIKARRLPPNATPSDVDANVSHWRGALSGADHLDLRAGTYWFRATLINRGVTDRTFQLINNLPWINELALYRIDSQGNVQTLVRNEGLKFSYLPRITTHHDTNVNIELPANEIITLLWKIESKPIFRFKPTLWEEGSFEQNDYLETLVFGFFYGALSALLIYSVYLWIISNNKVWLYFSTYLFTVYYLLAADNGDLYQFIFPSFAWPKITVYTIVYTIHVSSFCLFISSLLSLRKNLPRHNLILQVFAGTSALLLLIGNFFHQEFAFISALWFCSALFLFSLLTVLSFYTKKASNDWTLIIASVIASVTAIVNCMALTSPISISDFDSDILRGFGVVLTQLLFSLAISKKVFFNTNKKAA